MQNQNQNAYRNQHSQNESPRTPRERNFFRGRDNHNRNNYQNRYNMTRNKLEEETVEHIKEDIMRIEKEIELEIKEIRSLKL